jgi:hypothetical protein
MRDPVKISGTAECERISARLVWWRLWIAPAIKPIDYHLSEKEQAAPAFRLQLPGILTAVTSVSCRLALAAGVVTGRSLLDQRSFGISFFKEIIPTLPIVGDRAT